MKKSLFFAIIIFVGIILYAVYFFSRPTITNIPTFTNIPSGGFPGLQTTLLPWSVETDHLKERLDILHLPALKQEGIVLHTHQHIDIYIQGNHIDIPQGIGINEKAGFISPIHVHDETNIIHVESPTVQKFTLGQFFDIWGLRFSDACIGGYCSDTLSKLQVFINGKEILNNFRGIELTPHEEIVVIYGKEKEVPSPIPTAFDFPSGL